MAGKVTTLVKRGVVFYSTGAGGNVFYSTGTLHLTLTITLTLSITLTLNLALTLTLTKVIIAGTSGAIIRLHRFLFVCLMALSAQIAYIMP